MTTPEDPFVGRRRRFRGEVFAAVASVATTDARGHARDKDRWSQRRGLLAKERDGVFYAARIWPQTDSETTDFTLEAKPMAIDRILWDILEMPETADEPICYRARGAFSCEAPAIAARTVEDRGLTPVELAELFLAFARDETDRAAKVMAHGSFAEFLSASPEQIEFGAYAIPLFCAYVAEDALSRAWTFAEANAPEGSVESGLAQDDFFSMALDWLASARRAKTIH